MAIMRVGAIVLLVLLVFIKSADSRKLNNRRSLYAQNATCGSFFYNTQVNNDQGWEVVPQECVGEVGSYMEGPQYGADTYGEINNTEAFLETVTLTGDGKDVVVFDIDETSLSNLPYYRTHEYGGDYYNDTSFNEWVLQGIAPAVPQILQLYNALKTKFGIVFLTGRSESQRNITIQNLYYAGYANWTELILKSPNETGTTALVYKSKKRTELNAKGYHIYTSIGDQWSDITGPYVGNRTFKVPNVLHTVAV